MQSQIDAFIRFVRRRNPEAQTWRNYRGDLRQFRAVVGDRPLAEITLHDIDRFVQDQSARGLRPATINRRLTAVMAFFQFLADTDPHLVSPVIPRRHFVRMPQRLPRTVNPADVKAFFAVIQSPRDRAIFLLMLRCGLRISEVAKLRLQDVTLQDEPARLHIQGKNSKERTVYLTGQALRALGEYLAIRPTVPCAALFLNYKAEPLAPIGIHKRLERYREQAGVQLTAHQLRHNFANDLIAGGMPITSIQQLLGHARISTTQVYLAANDPQVRADFFAVCDRIPEWQDE